MLPQVLLQLIRRGSRTAGCTASAHEKQSVHNPQFPEHSRNTEGAPSFASFAKGGKHGEISNSSPNLLSTRTGFVVLIFTLSVAGFVLTPAGNGFSRHFEHQADVYGQEAMHGIVPDPQKTAVAAFNDLGKAWLDDPNPSPFIELWLYNHPSTQTRANFAAHYDPWANGAHGQFFAK